MRPTNEEPREGDSPALAACPCAHGGPALTGRMRVQPEDFVVAEELGFAPDGHGEHVLLTVQKRNANTDWVADQLARFAGVASKAVGYAGRKDRHAVTRQTFSVQLPGRDEPDWMAFAGPEARVLASARHGRKLKPGALTGNRFEITLRDVSGDADAAHQRLQALAASGVPNYFGPQRFGHADGNVQRARSLFRGARMKPKARSMLLSAARARIFNDVLARRVSDATWNRALDGEVWGLDGSRSHFGPEAYTDELAQRLADGDIHPTGPLWGCGPLPTQAQTAALEQAVAAADTELATGLEAKGLTQARRALRVLPRELNWQWSEPTTLVLTFALPAGCYATSALRELVVSPSA